MLLPVLLAYSLIRLFAPYYLQISYIYQVNRMVMNIWAPMVGLRLRAANNPNINKGEPYIVVMNHINILDMFLAAKCLKLAGKPLIKKQILKVPILGWMFAMSAIPVDRNSKKNRNQAYLKMRQEIKRKVSLLIFPEGSRNRGEKALNSFKTGAFKISIETNTKILPVVIINSRKMAFGSSPIIKPGSAQLFYLQPIDPKNFCGSADVLKNYCFNEMKNAISSLDKDLNEGQNKHSSIST